MLEKIIDQCTMWLSIAFKLSKVFQSNWLAFTNFWSKFYEIFCAGVKPEVSCKKNIFSRKYDKKNRQTDES